MSPRAWSLKSRDEIQRNTLLNSELELGAALSKLWRRFFWRMFCSHLQSRVTLSWKQTQHIPGKRWEISTSLHGVTFQRTWWSKSVWIQIDTIYLLLTLFCKRQSWLSSFFALSVQPVNTSAGFTQALLYTSLPIHANSGASVVKYTHTHNIQWWHRKQSFIVSSWALKVAPAAAGSSVFTNVNTA